MSLRIGIGTNLRITPSLFSWQAYWTTRSNFWLTGERSGLSLTDKYGNNPSLLLPYFKSNDNSRYAKFVDSSRLLDVGANDEFTVCGWAKSESTSKAAYREIMGKFLTGVVNGRYGIWTAVTTGYISASITTSSNSYVIASTVDYTSAGWVFLRMDIKQSTKKLRFFINEVQVGADVDFLGTFNNLPVTAFFGLSAGNDATGSGGGNWYGKSSHSDTYVFHKRLTPTEGATLMARGYVSEAISHWSCSNPQSTFLFESENGYHATIVGDYTVTTAYGAEGSRYLLDKGYTLYSNAFNDYYLPLKSDGTENSVTWPATHTGTKKKWVRIGMTTEHNLASSMLLFAGSEFDRSNVTIYNDWARNITSSFYDAINPKAWHIEELNNLMHVNWFNVGYKGLIFVKTGTSTYYHREKLENVFCLSENATGTIYNNALTFCGDLPTDGIYEAEEIYYKWDSDDILFARLDYRLKYADGKMMFSTDKGVTYPYEHTVGDITPTHSYIFSNGKILFSYDAKFYSSVDNLANVIEESVTAFGGGAYSPADAASYMTSSIIGFTEINGVDVSLVGTYRTTALGNDPDINVFEIRADQIGIRSIYHAGVTDPPLLPALHVHSLSQRSPGVFWLFTGDNNAGHTYEVSIISGTVDASWNWVWAQVTNEETTDIYKMAGGMFCDDNVFLAGADDTVSQLRTGLWSCDIDDILTPATFVRRFSSPIVVGGILWYGDNLIAHTQLKPNTRQRFCIISSQNQIAGIIGNRIYAPYSGVPYENLWRCLPPDNDGWHLDHYKTSTELFAEVFLGGVLWIKFK
jgi:hypothetical protein